MADIPAGGAGVPLLPGLTTPHRILSKGYKISGDAVSGYRATIPYLVRWDDAFTFVDELFSASTATSSGGAITWKTPHKLPFTDAPLYARSFEIDPVGLSDDGAKVLDPGTFLGLAPGGFYGYARITATYQTPDAPQQAAEGELHQLDPANPITVCRQSVRASGKMETLKSGNYFYDNGASPPQPVSGDYAVPVCESILELDFPEIPYLPWIFVEPYIGKVNAGALLGVAAGRLLLEGMTTRVEFTTQGMAQMINLSFAVCPASATSWNHLPKAGVPTLVKRASGSGRIYDTANFADIFNALDRS